MRSQVLYAAILFVMCNVLRGQVIEKDMNMSEGVQNALTLKLSGANKKRAEGVWKKYTKKYGKMERNKSANEYVLADIIIAAADPDYPLTIYTKFDEYDEMTRAYFWFKVDDRFLNSIDDEQAVNGIDVFLNDYALLVEKEVVRDELKVEEKNLKKLQRQLNKLEKRNKDLHKNIVKAEESIRKAQDEIETNIKAQETAREEVRRQEQNLKIVSDKMNRLGKNKF